MSRIDVYKEWLGIPEGDRPPDHYALLRLVPFEDDVDKIRGNYKKLNTHVRKYATGTYAAESQELLNELAKAMLCLTDPQRKREYDEQHGREFADDADPLGRKPTERVLVERGLITRDQAREATEFAEARGLSVRDAVVQMQLVEHAAAASAYAVELGLPYVDLEDMLPEDAVLDGVPRHVVKRNSILPLFEDGGMLLVACADMPGHELEEELRLRFEVPMRPVIATPRAIQQAIARYYAPGARDESAAAAKPKAAKPGKAAKGNGKAKDGTVAKAEKTKAAPAPAPRSGPLTDAEKAERRKLGIVFICWSIIVPVVIEYYLVKGLLFPGWWALFGFLGPITLLVTPLAILAIVMTYFRD